MTKKEKAEQAVWEKFIDECVQDERIKKCTTDTQVFNIINRDLQKQYKGKAPVTRIAFVAEDITESICIRMGIDMKHQLLAAI